MYGTKILGITTKHYGVDFTKYPTQQFAKHVVDQYKTRAADNAQFLRWTKLPFEIHGKIPKMWGSFEKFAGNKKVVFIDLGGSKNPPAAATDLMGLDLHNQRKMSVAFLKPVDYNDVISQIKDVENTVLVISSKSGKTPEIIAMAKALRNHFVNHYVSKGKTSLEAAEQANKQIMVVSDKNPKKSILRDFAQQNNLFDAHEGEFDVADGLGGRFSTAAGYMTAAIKAAGGTLKHALGFNEGAMKAIENGLSTDFNKNVPLQNALFYTDAAEQHAHKIESIGELVKSGEITPKQLSRMNLAQNEVNLYMGNTWEKGKTFDYQLNGESIKKGTGSFSVMPDANHYLAESWFNPENNNVFSLVTSDDIGEGSLRYASEHYISDSIFPDIKKFGPVVHTHIHDVTKNGHLTPEVTGVYMVNKEFETVDRGFLKDLVQGKEHLAGAQDTVTQKAVESVKESNQKIIENYEDVVSEKNRKHLLD